MKAEAALGFAMRAGKLITGDPNCEKAIKQEKRGARVVVLDESASANTREKFGQMCQKRDIPIFMLCGMGTAIGKDSRIVSASCDTQFADLIISAFGGRKLSRADELAAAIQGKAAGNS